MRMTYKSSKLFLVFVALLFVNSAFGKGISSRLSTITHKFMERGISPGLSVQVVINDKVIYSEVIGLADLENPMPVSSETVYRIGSLTKQFTAAAVMTLVQQNKLSLDDRINQYIENAPKGWRQITIKNLLQHTSGIASFTSSKYYIANSRLDFTHDELLQTFINEELRFKPGTQWRYSNSGYYLLGLIIEKVSGVSYETYLEDSIFRPLSLNSTFYCDYKKLIPNRASGYTKENNEWFNSVPISVRTAFAAGALCSNTKDLMTWSMAISSGKVMADQAYQKMISRGRFNNGKTFDYGFGLEILDFNDYKKIHHGGRISGFGSLLSFYPGLDMHIVVLANSSRSLGNLERTLAEAIFEFRKDS